MTKSFLTRKPIRKISEKRLKQLSGNGISLYPNSTIRRKPCQSNHCDATIAEKNYAEAKKERENTSLQLITDSISVNRSLKPAVTILRSNFIKQRKPVNKQSAKQKARLQRLAAIRQRWWNEAQSRGETLICGICDEGICTFEELASDHVEPGNAKSDSEDNLQPSHGI